MSITTRAGKGAALTHNEMDTNFTDLRDGVNIMVPRTQNAGIKTDSLGTPTYSWRDVNVPLRIDEAGGNKPLWATYINGIKQLQFSVNDEGFFTFHIPHEYVVGTPIYVHAHWSHASTLVTGGAVDWHFELSAARGHDQDAFNVPSLTIHCPQNASLIQYRHMIAEAVASTADGSGGTLLHSQIEPDTIILGKISLVSNTITVSGGGVPKPFLHEVDIHMQTTAVGTKDKAPPFWGV